MLLDCHDSNLSVLPYLPQQQGKRKRHEDRNDQQLNLQPTTSAAAARCNQHAHKVQGATRTVPEQHPLRSSNNPRERECLQAAENTSTTTSQQPGSPYEWYDLLPARKMFPTPGDDGGIWDSLLGEDDVTRSTHVSDDDQSCIHDLDHCSMHL